MGEPRLLPLFRKREIVAHTIVDAADYLVLANFRWALTNGYAYRSVRVRGRTQTYFIHRLLLGLEPGDGLEGDHRNRNKLDNRRENLWVVTRSGNEQNKGKKRNAQSRFVGVTRDNWTGKWKATACGIHLGMFLEEEMAAAVVEDYRRYHQPFYVPN